MRSSAFLVKRLAARDELLTICSDTISTPMEISYGNSLQRKINNDFECLRIATAVSLDSRTNDILQLADLIAGAVRYSRTHKNSGNTLTLLLYRQGIRLSLIHISEPTRPY